MAFYHIIFKYLYIFSCVAVHSTVSGAELKTSQNLVVLYPPNAPVVSINGHNLGDSLRSGQDITLQCESYGGNPLASLEWYKNGDKIDTTYNTHDHHKSVNTLTFTANEDDNNAKVRFILHVPGQVLRI